MSNQESKNNEAVIVGHPEKIPGHPDSYHKMANEFEDVSCALASLGELIKRADEDRLEEFTFNGIGFLLDILGKHLMDNCFEALDMASEASKQQESNKSTGLSKSIEKNQSRI